MRRKDVKTVIAYYFGIPAMRALLADERAELEGEYDGLRGAAYDGMPHSSTPGNPTETLALRADARNVWNRMEEITVKDRVLTMDRDMIQGCLDAIKGEYKRLIFSKYRDRYSWARIAAASGVPDRTVRWWHEKAMDRLGEALEEVPMVDELLGRASRARIEVAKGELCAIVGREFSTHGREWIDDGSGCKKTEIFTFCPGDDMCVLRRLPRAKNRRRKNNLRIGRRKAL